MLKISVVLSGLVLAVLTSLSSAKPSEGASNTQSIIKPRPTPGLCQCLPSGSVQWDICDQGACTAFCSAVYHENKGVCH